MKQPADRPVHTIDLEVRYAETDQMGVVHHANYLIWFEAARTALCATTPFPYAAVEAMGYWLMVTGAHLSYRDGARYPDVVQVASWVDRYASRVMHFGYEVSVADRRLVSGTTEHAWVDSKTRKTCRIPEQLAPIFRELAGLPPSR